MRLLQVLQVPVLRQTQRSWTSMCVPPLRVHRTRKAWSHQHSQQGQGQGQVSRQQQMRVQQWVQQWV
jgi:hypothetical protein